MGKLLTGVFAMFSQDKRDWIFIAWCAAVLVLLLGQWIAIWRLNANESWSPVEFLIVMLGPIIYYTAAHLLVTGQPESIDSWSDHLAKVARPLIWIMLAALANSFLRTYVVLETFNSNLFLFISVPLFVVNLATLVWPTRWLLAVTGLGWLIPPGLLMVISGDL